MKYFDVHMKVSGDSKKGYSVFVKLPDATTCDDAINEVIKKELYEDKEDIKNIDWVGEITEKEYEAAYSKENN